MQRMHSNQPSQGQRTQSGTLHSINAPTDDVLRTRRKLEGEEVILHRALQGAYQHGSAGGTVEEQEMLVDCRSCDWDLDRDPTLWT